MAFATPAELSAYTSGLIPANDPRSERVLQGASHAIQRYAGWQIAPRQVDTAIMDGDGSDTLQLPTLQLHAVSAVSVLGELLDPSTYEWTRLGMVRRLSGYFPSRWNAVTITFEHGFDEVPDLSQVVLQVAAQALSSPTGATREQAGQVAMSWALTAPGVAGGLSLLDRDLAVVNTYKLPGRL